MTADSELQRYAWADAEGDTDALGMLYVRPRPSSPTSGLRIVSKFPGELSFREAIRECVKLDDFAWGSELLQTDQLGDWAVLISPMGWATSTPKVVAASSAGGDAVSLFWNVNAVMRLIIAKDGAVVRSFDPLLYNDGDAPLRVEADLPFGEPGRCRAAALAVAERLTGQAVDLGWLLGRSRETYRVALPPVIT